ncbi:hypothetical protein Tco_1453997, partial [Tanacetum coccineum]
METEAIDNQANLVNYDDENENEIEDLRYESEKYTEDAHEDDENNHSNGYAKRGITRLCKFRREYGKPDGVDALNMISGKHRALFYEFFRRRWFVAYRFCRFYPGRRWVDEKRNKLGMKSRYTYTIFEPRVKLATGKMARSEGLYLHTIGRGGCAHVKEQMVSLVEIHPINSSADEEGGTTVVGCDQNDASIQKEMPKRETVKSVGAKRMTSSSLPPTPAPFSKIKPYQFSP